MAKKEISIVLRAKNAMSAGIKSAGAALKSFGGSVVRIGKGIAVGMLAAGAAVAAFAGKALKAYAEQEKAEESVAAALNAHGESSKSLLQALKAQAEAIQDETGAADESTLAGMAKMRMLGVQTSRLGEAAKAVIALKGVGLDEAAAQKAVAMAMQGNYEMLNRYVPALRSATSEQEKARIVADLFSKGYAQQADLLNTTAGQWAALKGRIGDLWETIGRLVAQDGAVSGMLKRAADAVKEFAQAVDDWSKSGGMVNVSTMLKNFANEAKHSFMMASNSVHIAMAAIADGAQSTWNTIKGIFTGNIPDPISKRTEAAMMERNALIDEYGKAAEEIAAEHADAIAKHEEKLAEESGAGMSKVATAISAIHAYYQKLADVRKTAIDSLKKKEVEAIQAQKAAQLKAHQDRLAQIEAEKQKVDELAQSTVSSYIESQRAAKDLADEKKMDMERGAKLEQKVARGTKLAGKDAEFLKGYRAVQGAKSESARLGAEAEARKAEIAKLSPEAQSLDSIDRNIETIKTDIVTLMSMG